MLQFIDLSPYCQYFRRSMKKLFTNKQLNFQMITAIWYKSGFKNNHSTNLFLSFLNDKGLKGFLNGMCTGIILIDLQKAFDMINHKILLYKLLLIGFSKNTISWYEFNLEEHHFTLEVAGCVSKLIQNFKIGFRKYFMWCSARSNIRCSTVSDLCQWYEPISCRMRLVTICR